MDVKDLTLAHVKSHLQVRGYLGRHCQPALQRPELSASSRSCHSLLLFGSDKNAIAATPELVNDGETGGWGGRSQETAILRGERGERKVHGVGLCFR
jgi:hypothetical protein